MADYNEERASSFDDRQEQIAASIGAHFGFAADHKALASIEHDETVRSFLDDASCPGLVAKYDNHNQEAGVTFSTVQGMDTTSTEANSIVLFKIRPDVLSPSSFKTNVFTSSLTVSSSFSFGFTVSLSVVLSLSRSLALRS